MNFGFVASLIVIITAVLSVFIEIPVVSNYAFWFAVGAYIMDQPETLGDAAFRDTGASLRREGQSFRQIAEALELSGGASPRYEDTVQKGVVLHPMEMEGEPDGPAWPRAPTLPMRIVGYPFRHPIRFLTIALLAVMHVSHRGCSRKPPSKKAASRRC